MAVSFDTQCLRIKPMKAINSAEFPLLVTRILKLVGVILILVSLVDFVVLSSPFNPLARDWQINFATLLVDRGVVPLVGLALLFTGYWIDSIASDPASTRSLIGGRFWALLFSSLLGLLFLLLVPLHTNNVVQARDQAIQQINQDASQAQARLQSQLGDPQAEAAIQNQQSQLKSQIGALLQNEQLLNQALGSPQVPEQFKNLLRKAKANPQGVDQLLKQQFNTEALRTQGLTQIQSRQTDAVLQAEQGAWRSGLRVGLSSLLLAIAYIAIGWIGLRSLRAQQL